jgi:hypothetical protein
MVIYLREIVKLIQVIMQLFNLKGTNKLILFSETI